MVVGYGKEVLRYSFFSVLRAPIIRAAKVCPDRQRGGLVGHVFMSKLCMVVMFHILSIVILELKPAIYFHLSLT